MPRTIHIKRKIKPSACQATNNNGTRYKSITSSLSRRGLKTAVVLGLAGVLGIANVSALGKQIYFSVDASEPVLEISIDGSTTMQITPTNGGSFGYQNIPVTIGTNSATGYKLTMYAEEPVLSCKSNTSCKNSTIETLTSSVSSETFSTTGNTSNNDVTMNKWGYSTGNFTTYNTMPDGTNTSAVEISSNNKNIDSEVTNIRFGVKMNNDTPAGTYGTTITFIAVTDRVETCGTNTICYVSNGTSGGMDTQTASGTTTTLWASNFKNPLGYGFAGWSEVKLDPDSATFFTDFANAVNAGKLYGPNEDIASTKASSGLYLYATWVPSAGSLQGWTGCSTLADGAVTALTDTRDNNTYAVAKLADGKCWMTENLRLNNLPTLSSANTNVPNGWAGMITDYTTGTTSSHLAVPSASAEYWCTGYDNVACVNQSRLSVENTADSVPFMNSADNGVFSYGNYYNWYAATAGSGNYDVKTNNLDVEYSVCPSRWRLPSGGRAYAEGTTATGTTNRNIGVDMDSSDSYIGFSDFYKLSYYLMNSDSAISDGSGTTAYMSHATGSVAYYASSTISTNTNDKFADKNASAVFRSYPNNFLLSSHRAKNNSVRGSGGTYWTSTNVNQSAVYAFELSPLSVYPGTRGNYYYAYEGLTVRCVTGN